MNKTDFFVKGWCRFDYDAKLAKWVQYALPYARAAVSNTENQQWLRCGKTWFVGVNVLPNASDGSLAEGPKLECDAVDYISQQPGLNELKWDAAQISVCYPGYPKPREGESTAAFRFRRERDAAHADGLLPEGSGRHRHLREYHGFILGIPMVEYDPGASPLAVWEGSHEIIREEFRQCFKNLPSEQWGELDLTDIYHRVRHRIFESCQRVIITARPGEAYLVHRLALHGITPWQEAAGATEDGRMICYFRPETSGPEGWLFNP